MKGGSLHELPEVREAWGRREGRGKINDDVSTHGWSF